MTDIVLFGIGSPLVVEYAETCRRLGYRIVAAIKNRPGPVFFVDQDATVDVRDLAPALRGVACLCPMFTPRNRAAAVDEATALGLAFAPALIDPTAIVASTARAGAGSFINAGGIIGAQAILGEHVVVNRGATVGHNAALAAFVSLGPGAILAGQVTVAERAMIGAGAVVLPSVTIGPDVVVGAGAVVIRDVPAGAKVFGSPARIMPPSD